ncbi:LysR family transcriptional regulator [Vibrio caribbeanicus ATCC BAA-2122]|uniref:LysR family transcriptional regulator n=2 Tax=Vibrio caribbeanicus TaxID=701175 RepID=E3BN69_9VIBR|nr:LysR family transcriptional regulator [Vibrio caribbeanicus ATCC BAA-2122]
MEYENVLDLRYVDSALASAFVDVMYSIDKTACFFLLLLFALSIMKKLCQEKTNTAQQDKYLFQRFLLVKVKRHWRKKAKTMLLEGIETLLVLSKTKTMSRAGSHLYISQSAVSKRIANLERKLGKKLILPDGRNIQLTRDAQNLIESIGPTFNELRGLINEQQLIEQHSTLKFDCSETLVSGLLTNVFRVLFSRDPNFKISTNHTPRIVENVKSGRAHVGVCAGYLPPQHGLMTFHLFDEPSILISDQKLTKLPSKIITNDLSNPAYSYQLNKLTTLGIVPIMEMDSYIASAKLALAGVAPALVPVSIINVLKIDPSFCFYFKPLKSLARPLHICLRHSSYKNGRIKTLADYITDSVKSDSDNTIKLIRAITVST